MAIRGRPKGSKSKIHTYVKLEDLNKALNPKALVPVEFKFANMVSVTLGGVDEEDNEDSESKDDYEEEIEELEREAIQDLNVTTRKVGRPKKEEAPIDYMVYDDREEPI